MAEKHASQFVVVYYTTSGAGEVNAVGPYRSPGRAQAACDRLTVIHDESDSADMLPPSVMSLHSERYAADQIRNS